MAHQDLSVLLPCIACVVSNAYSVYPFRIFIEADLMLSGYSPLKYFMISPTSDSTC